MSKPRAKARAHALPAPFEQVEVDVSPVHLRGADEPFALSVSVMDREAGQGHRYSMEYAEALAKTLLKATRAYRRANPELVAGIEERRAASRKKNSDVSEA